MFVVPLFLEHPVGGADASHCVHAPRGYEYWRIFARDEASQIELIVGFFDGHPSLPAYVRRYWRYLRRPTSNKPPLPRDFQVLEVEMRSPAHGRFQAVDLLPPGSLQTSCDRLEISTGSSSLRRNPDQSLELKLAHRQVAAELLFSPQVRTESPHAFCVVGAMGFVDDRAHVVIGTLALKPAAALTTVTRRINFRGKGGLEHRWRVNRAL